jgi:TRAP-type mannitol/chloroaromatic compound transport system substrate-binding protein
LRFYDRALRAEFRRVPGLEVYGGGNKLREEIYAKHDLYAVDCFCIGPETSRWFRNEIKSVEDLKGLKMRFFGLGAQVMQKLGVSTQLLAAADIYQALERGVIDATEFSMPMMDISSAFIRSPNITTFPAGTSKSPAASSS